MITDLVQIQLLGEKKRDENWRFRTFLKGHRHSDRKLRKIAEGIEEQIDCTQCGNCCLTSTTRISERDIDRLAHHLGITTKQFMAEYTMKDDEGELSLRFENGSGCVFLQDKMCRVYEARPDTCRRYPHLVRGNGSIASRMWSIVERAALCPIVYHSLEAFKEELGFRR